MLRIKEVLATYNENRGDKPKITQEKLGKLVIGDSVSKTCHRVYVANWIKGNYGTLKIEYIPKLCEILEVDFNTLFGKT